MKYTFSTLAVCLSLACAAPVFAQEDPAAGDTTETPAEPAGEAAEFPMPEDGWWEALEVGTMAKYQVVQMGQTMEMEFLIDAVNGSEITIMHKMKMGGMEPPPQTRVIDAKDAEQLRGEMPADAKVVKAGSETIEAAGRSWDCTIYEVDTVNQGVPVKIKMWHCADLPACFNNSSVKMEMEIEQQGMKINAALTLLEFGKAEAAPADDGAGEDPAQPETGDGQ